MALREEKVVLLIADISGYTDFMLANEKRAPYDYFMIALGPVPFAVLATDKEGAVNRFKPDGSLLSVAPFQPQPPTSAALDAA